MSPSTIRGTTPGIVGAVSVEKGSALIHAAIPLKSSLKGSGENRARPALRTKVTNRKCVREFVADHPNSKENWTKHPGHWKDHEYRHKKEKRISTPENNECNLEKALNIAFWRARKCESYLLEGSGSAQSEEHNSAQSIEHNSVRPEKCEDDPELVEGENADLGFARANILWSNFGREMFARARTHVTRGSYDCDSCCQSEGPGEPEMGS